MGLIFFSLFIPVAGAVVGKYGGPLIGLHAPWWAWALMATGMSILGAVLDVSIHGLRGIAEGSGSLRSEIEELKGEGEDEGE